MTTTPDQLPPEPADGSIVAFYDSDDCPAAAYCRTDEPNGEDGPHWYLTDTQWEPLTWAEVCEDTKGLAPYMLHRGEAVAS